jgi:hypothetical protein
MVGEKHIVGAVVMGDQTLSRPVQHIVSQRLDISSIRPSLLAAGADLSSIIVKYWIEFNKQAVHYS